MGKFVWKKLNIIDLVFIVLVMISLFALIYKIAWDSKTDQTQTYLFTYVCPSAPEEIFNDITPGLSCTDGDYGTQLGQLTSIQTEPDTQDNTKQRALFTSALTGTKTTHGVTVDEVIYLKGKELNLVIGDSIFSVYLSDIRSITE